MKSLLRAITILGSSSAISVLTGLFASKVYAVLIGPEGMGLLGLLQSFLQISVMTAGVGIPVGLVRLGAALIEAGKEVKVGALRQAAWRIFWVAGLLVTAVIWIFRGSIAGHVWPGHSSEGILWANVAVLFTLASGVQVGLLNAHHRVGSLARATAFSSAVGALAGVLLVWFWRESALPFVLVTGGFSSWLFSRYYLSTLLKPSIKATSLEVNQATRQLLLFGFPYVGSMLVGTGIQTAMPLIIAAQLSQEDVGYYRAATLFSVAYIGFLLNALSQDYYPRVSAVRDVPDALRHLINQQLQVVLLVGSPLVLLTSLLAPQIVTLAFSPQFLPATQILQWQLTGDILKFASWTLSFVVLARSPSAVYFLVEAVAGITLLVSSWLGMAVWGLWGLGVSYFVTYAIYGAVLLMLQWRDLKLKLAPVNVALILMALGIAFGIKALPRPWNFAVAALGVVGFLAMLFAFYRRSAHEQPSAG